MSLGPLTTSFTPPADCTASSALYWVNTASTFYWLHGQPGQSSCFPDNYSPYQNQYYSPGICPAGYTRACESASSGGDNVATTRATCCPEGNYVCAATSSSYSYPWGPTLGCMSVYRVNTETRFTTINGTMKGGETAGAPRSLRAPGTIMAYGVVIRNIATSTGNGVIASSSISVSVSNSGMASETASSMPTTEAPQSNSSGGNGGLSSGAAAGIGIATSFGIMAIGGALLWIFWMRRRKRKQEMAAEHGRGAVATPGAWSSTTWNTTPYPQQPVFQANWAPTELDNEREPKEMSAESPIPVEKDGKSLGPR
ncbi:hypothetical protein F5Y13DRAFT_168865 [Hypoxylon sp. FL1857]|nr:hypothetical protein F5Y13DRAFT_168865 [Hypoxylon sp. FL1857]